MLNNCPHCGANCHVLGFLFRGREARRQKADYICRRCGRFSMAEEKDYGCFRIVLILPYIAAVEYVMHKQSFAPAIRIVLAVTAACAVIVAHILFLMFLVRLKPINESQN